MSKFIVRRTFLNDRNVLAVLVDFYITVDETQKNEFNMTVHDACRNDPSFEKSRAQLAVSLSGGLIESRDEGRTIFVAQAINFDAENCADPDAPTKEEIYKLAEKRLGQLMGLVNRDLKRCYEYAGLSGEVKE